MRGYILSALRSLVGGRIADEATRHEIATLARRISVLEGRVDARSFAVCLTCGGEAEHASWCAWHPSKPGDPATTRKS